MIRLAPFITTNANELAMFANQPLRNGYPTLHIAIIPNAPLDAVCVEKNEIQSNYFQRTECSLHVTIIHRHAILEYDGLDSTDDFPEIITEHFFVISPYLQHDHNFTKCAQQQIKQYLDSISYDVDVMHEFTDGCSSQYKSRHCLGNLSFATTEYAGTKFSIETSLKPAMLRAQKMPPEDL